MTSKPGIYPYTRGIHKEMYRQRLWTMRQYSGYGSAKETNHRFHYLLKQGQTGLSTAFDLPTQLGFDSNQTEAKNEVGRVGVAISHIKDMEALLHNIPLDKVSLSMTINAPAAILFAMVLAIAKKRKIPWSKLRGTVQNDILKEYLARGTYIFPAKESLRLATDLIEFSVKKVPNWNPISVSGYHIREAGATAAQELALTLAHAQTTLDDCLKRKLSIDQFASKISFFFSVDNNFFEEISKFRTARKLWAEILKKKYRAKQKKSQQLRFHAQTSGASLTAQQPENNLVRVTYQALAAVLGGAQSLHTNAMDEALALPSEESAKLALRTQQIISSESGIPAVADPLGGSEFLEQKTKQLEKEVLQILKKIDQAGGTLAALESGLSRRLIEDSFLKTQQKIECQEKKIVGVNCYKESDSKFKVPSSTFFKQLEREQSKQVKQVKSKRNHKKIETLLKKLEDKASQSTNLMPLLIELVEKGATVGEICATLKTVWGEYAG